MLTTIRLKTETIRANMDITLDNLPKLAAMEKYAGEKTKSIPLFTRVAGLVGLLRGSSTRPVEEAASIAGFRKRLEEVNRLRVALFKEIALQAVGGESWKKRVNRAALLLNSELVAYENGIHYVSLIRGGKQANLAGKHQTNSVLGHNLDRIANAAGNTQKERVELKQVIDATMPNGS